MCSLCNEAGKFEQCGSCRAAAQPVANTAFPFRRDTLALGALFDFSWQVYKRNFVLVTLLMLALLGGTFVLQGAWYALQMLFVDEPVVMVALSTLGFAVQLVVQGALLLGVLGISLRLVRGEPVHLGMLRAGLSRLPALFVQALVLQAGLMAGAFLAAIPIVAIFYFASDAALPLFAAAGLLSLLAGLLLLYVGLGLAFSAIELVAQPSVGPFAAIQNSWLVARDQRLTLFLSLLALAALFFAGTMACFVGLVFTLGFGTLFFATLYLALRNGAPGLSR